MEHCDFCDKEEMMPRTISKNDKFIIIRDKTPVKEGHLLIIPKRHFNSLSEMDDEEAVSLKNAIKDAKEILLKEVNAGGFNIGVNEGGCAGQTIFHLHIHVIPRHEGDINNPIGGIRNIFPEKGDYTKC